MNILNSTKFYTIIFSLVLFTKSDLAFAAKYFMVSPQENNLEIPSDAIVWKAKAKSEDHSKAFLFCEEDENPRLRSALGAFQFKNSESCAKLQMMLRLASPQCPLEIKVNDKEQKINSFRLECDRLKL